MNLRRSLPVLVAGWLASGCGATDAGPAQPSDGSPPLASGAGAIIPVDVATLPELPADPREAALAETLEGVLATRHLDHRPVDDTLSKAAFSIFVRSLDDRKLFLLSTHVAALATFADQMDDQMKRRDLLLARKGAGVLAERQRIAAAMVKEILASPLDLTQDEEVETNPDKLSFCATDAELRERWRKMLELEVLRAIAAEGGASAPDPAALAPREAAAREALDATLEARFARLANPDSLAAAERFANAIATAYDAHTRYVSPAARSQFVTQTTGTLEGVGATLVDEGGRVVVQELVAGGAAWNHSDLAVGDVVVAIAQAGEAPVPMTGVPLDKAAAMLRGPAGTKVSLTVEKAGGKTHTIVLTRAVIEIAAAYARGFTIEHPARPGEIGYVYLPSFYDQGGALAEDRVRNATADIRRYLEAFAAKKVRGVVLDLRSNRGGLLLHAQHIAGLLIKKGPVVQTRHADGKIDVLSDIHPAVTFGGDVVLLIDRFSASATEVLAGALQDYRRAVVVGTGPTWGKGTVQDVVDLDRERFGAAPREGGSLGLLALTTQQYYRVTGASTQWRGVEPDVLLPDPAAHLSAGERELDHTLAFGTIAALPFEPQPVSWSIPDLAARSRARVAAQPVFAAFQAREKILAGQRHFTVEPLRIGRWWDEQARASAELAALDTRLAATRFAVKIVPDSGAAGAASTALARWREELGRDPWVEEALHVVLDMGSSP